MWHCTLIMAWFLPLPHNAEPWCYKNVARVSLTFERINILSQNQPFYPSSLVRFKMASFSLGSSGHILHRRTTRTVTAWTSCVQLSRANNMEFFTNFFLPVFHNCNRTSARVLLLHSIWLTSLRSDTLPHHWFTSLLWYMSWYVAS